MQNKLRYNLNAEKAFTMLLNLTIKKAPVRVFIRLFSPEYPNTFYYSRKQDFSAPSKSIYRVNVPDFIKGSKLILEVFTDRQENINSLLSVDINMTALNKKCNIDPKIKPSVDFMRDFSMKSGFLKPNTVHGNGIIEIRLLPYITYPDGRIHSTPARIHKTADFIEVSKLHFDKMPVPRRNAILFHELAHNYISADPESEEEADDHSADIYLECGFPPSEFIYGFSTIFNQHPPKKFAQIMQNPNNRALHEYQVRRLQRMLNKMEKY
jgi:hypothetical protein